MEKEIVNKIAQSGLITLDLEDLYPSGERVVFDISQHLFHGLILKEKDFREFIQSNDWSFFNGKYVSVICSTDAIVPTWAYMLLAVSLEPFAKKVIFGNQETLESVLFGEELKKLDLERFKDARVIVKGCGKFPVPKNAYIEIARLLKPVVKSLMYGEPCSTVPLYKRK